MPCYSVGVLNRWLPIAALFSSILFFPALTQSQDMAKSPAPPVDVKPFPLLPPEGFDDGHGYVVPGADWAHATPESEGFSAARLEALRSFLKTHQTDAMMIVSRGHVVFEYGDLSLVSKVASVRKSVLDFFSPLKLTRGSISIRT